MPAGAETYPERGGPMDRQRNSAKCDGCTCCAQASRAKTRTGAAEERKREANRLIEWSAARMAVPSRGMLDPDYATPTMRRQCWEPSERVVPYIDVEADIDCSLRSLLFVSLAEELLYELAVAGMRDG